MSTARAERLLSSQKRASRKEIPSGLRMPPYSSGQSLFPNSIRLDQLTLIHLIFLSFPFRFIQDHIDDSTACAHCGRVFQHMRSTSLIASCTHPTPRRASPPSASSNGKHHPRRKSNDLPSKGFCEHKFCSRLCVNHSQELYGPYLLCPQANPQYKDLLVWADMYEARSAIVVFKMWARIFVAFSEGEKQGMEELEKWDALAAFDAQKRKETAE
jgi:hypothetical protein